MTTWREAFRSRGVVAWLIAALFFVFYLDLYFTEHMEPVARALGLRSRWFLYGLAYGLAMTGGAVYYLRRDGNARYNRARIAVNLGVQWLVAFVVPFAMMLLTGRDFYFSYLWPLKIDYFYPQTILEYPQLIVLYSFVASLVAVPVLTLLYGKRWYCSWVCGCGALANTLGDPWRHLSDKSPRAWRFEKVSVHSILVLAIVTTAIVLGNWAAGDAHPRFAAFAFRVQSVYGLVVGAILAGVIGVGLYPLMGTRVWCRFFCPMAAMLGLLQKLGRFRIRVKPDMCISCGNCSAYCEMGIDVRAYAQKNESFTRAACVGCGMCAHVCPRGVLKLENRWEKRRRLNVVG